MKSDENSDDNKTKKCSRNHRRSLSASSTVPRKNSYMSTCSGCETEKPPLPRKDYMDHGSRSVHNVGTYCDNNDSDAKCSCPDRDQILEFCEPFVDKTIPRRQSKCNSHRDNGKIRNYHSHISLKDLHFCSLDRSMICYKRLCHSDQIDPSSENDLAWRKGQRTCHRRRRLSSYNINDRQSCCSSRCNSSKSSHASINESDSGVRSGNCTMHRKKYTRISCSSMHKLSDPILNGNSHHEKIRRHCQFNEPYATVPKARSLSSDVESKSCHESDCYYHEIAFHSDSNCTLHYNTSQNGHSTRNGRKDDRRKIHNAMRKPSRAADIQPIWHAKDGRESGTIIFHHENNSNDNQRTNVFYCSEPECNDKINDANQGIEAANLNNSSINYLDENRKPTNNNQNNGQNNINNCNGDYGPEPIDRYKENQTNYVDNLKTKKDKLNHEKSVFQFLDEGTTDGCYMEASTSSDQLLQSHFNLLQTASTSFYEKPSSSKNLTTPNLFDSRLITKNINKSIERLSITTHFTNNPTYTSLGDSVSQQDNGGNSIDINGLFGRMKKKAKRYKRLFKTDGEQ